MQLSHGILSATLVTVLQPTVKTSSSAFSAAVKHAPNLSAQLTNGKNWSPSHWANTLAMRTATHREKLLAINNEHNPAEVSESAAKAEHETLQTLQTATQLFNLTGEAQSLIDALNDPKNKSAAKKFAQENHLLHQGVSLGRPKLFMAALTLGVDPNQRNQKGDTALCLAQKRMPPEYSRLP